MNITLDGRLCCTNVFSFACKSFINTLGFDDFSRKILGIEL